MLPLTADFAANIVAGNEKYDSMRNSVLSAPTLPATYISPAIISLPATSALILPSPSRNRGTNAVQIITDIGNFDDQTVLDMQFNSSWQIDAPIIRRTHTAPPVDTEYTYLVLEIGGRGKPLRERDFDFEIED